MKRERAFSAIIHNGKIVMVYHIVPVRPYWTLPGGGVENGENIEEAAIREAFEEVNLNINIIRFLFKTDYTKGIEYCFLAEPININDLRVGYDPEFDGNNQTLVKAEWKNINDVKDDIQVSLVLKSLIIEEFSK